MDEEGISVAGGRWRCEQDKEHLCCVFVVEEHCYELESPGTAPKHQHLQHLQQEKQHQTHNSNGTSSTNNDNDDDNNNSNNNTKMEILKTRASFNTGNHCYAWPHKA